MIASECVEHACYLLLGCAHSSIQGGQVDLAAAIHQAGSQLRAAAKVKVHIAAEDIAPGEALGHLCCALHLHPCLVPSLPPLRTQPLGPCQALAGTDASALPHCQAWQNGFCTMCRRIKMLQP